jgi:hypothetical protein
MNLVSAVGEGMAVGQHDRVVPASCVAFTVTRQLAHSLSSVVLGTVFEAALELQMNWPLNEQ